MTTPSQSPQRIFKDEVYSTITRTWFTQGHYEEALNRYLELTAQISEQYGPADCAVFWNRVGSCASNALLRGDFPVGTPQTDSLLDQAIHGIQQYIHWMQIAETEEPALLTHAQEEPLARFRELLELGMRYRSESLEGDTIQWVEAFSQVRLWGQALPLKVILEFIPQQRMAFNQENNLDHAKTLAQVYLQFTEGEKDSASIFARARVMNILLDIAYFEGGSEGEAQALFWAKRCLAIQPEDVFAKKQKAFIEQQQFVQSQIRRFQHDTNTAIADLRGSLKGLASARSQENQDGLPPFTENGVTWERLVHRMERDLEQIQGVHKLIQGQQASFVLIPILPKVEQWLQAYPDLQTTITSEGERSHWECDPSYLGLAVNNLVKNAWEAYERQPAKTNRSVQIHLQLDQEVLMFEDKAGGIDPRIKERVFEPYVSTKGIQKETGLGLYQAKTAVETLMGGRLFLSESQPEEGARFEIHLNP